MSIHSRASLAFQILEAGAIPLSSSADSLGMGEPRFDQRKYSFFFPCCSRLDIVFRVLFVLDLLAIMSGLALAVHTFTHRE